MNRTLRSLDVRDAIKRAAQSEGVSEIDPSLDVQNAAWSELHEARKAARKIYRNLADDNRVDVPVLEPIADRVRDLSEEIDARNGAGTREPIHHSAEPVPVPSDRVDLSAVGTVRGAETWRDAQTGREVRVLGRGGSFASLFQSPADGLSLGHCLRAMLTGPKCEAERRALGEGTDSAGGFTVPAPLLARFIDKLRARTVVFQSGARTVPMDSETLSVAKITGDPTTTWHAENAQESANDPTFGSVQFSAKTLLSLVRASRELITDSANAEEALEAAFAGALSVELDRAALFGAGSSTEPQGVSGASGVNSVSMGTNGAAPTGFSEILDLYQAILDDNAEPPTGAIMAPRTMVAYAKLTDSQNQPLMRPQLIADLPFRSTTSVPTDQTQGTSNDASTLLLGDWSRLLIGMRSEMRVEILRERYADSYQFGFLAHLRADVQLEHGESFGELIGLTP